MGRARATPRSSPRPSSLEYRRMPEPEFHDLLPAPAAGAATDPKRELAIGLMARPAAVSPKFFYDQLGSHLFDAITALDEYYPTRTEAAIMAQQQSAIAAAVHAALPGAFNLVDLGAGNGQKAERLFESLNPARYVALDISGPFLKDAVASLQRRHPQLPMAAVALDFSERLALPAGLLQGASLVYYPGSSIGNFNRPEALRLLRGARELAAGGALLIGVDWVKPAALLEEAYDDALGVTGAFNLNLLRHANHLLGSDFNPRQWRHVALFNSAASRIEMHLEARSALRVRWPGGERSFAKQERIHTENSYKWQPDDFAALLREAGFANVQAWSDEQAWFGVLLASA
jgi:L-histidine Nalpha-methyltransferase